MKKLITIILVIVITLMFSACDTEIFQSSALVKIEGNNEDYSILYPDKYANLLKSNTVITKISENLDFEISNRKLENSIVLRDIDNNGTFEIIVSYTDKESSEQILNALLAEYPLILKEYSSDLNFVIVSKSTDEESQ